MPAEERGQKENTASILKDVQDLHATKEEDEKAKGYRGAAVDWWPPHPPWQGDTHPG